MLMKLSWARGVEVCLQIPSGYLSAQCLFFVLFFQPAVNNFNGFWISPWYTNKSSGLILPLILRISSDAKWKQNSLLCNSLTASLLLRDWSWQGRKRSHNPLSATSLQAVKSEECRKSRQRPGSWNLSPRHQLWHPGQGEKAGQGMNCSLPLPLLCVKPLNPCPKGSQGAPARQGASNNAPVVLPGFSERCSI